MLTFFFSTVRLSPVGNVRALLQARRLFLSLVRSKIDMIHAEIRRSQKSLGPRSCSLSNFEFKISEFKGYPCCHFNYFLGFAHSATLHTSQFSFKKKKKVSIFFFLKKRETELLVLVLGVFDLEKRQVTKLYTFLFQAAYSQSTPTCTLNITLFIYLFICLEREREVGQVKSMADRL